VEVHTTPSMRHSRGSAAAASIHAVEAGLFQAISGHFVGLHDPTGVDWRECVEGRLTVLASLPAERNALAAAAADEDPSLAGRLKLELGTLERVDRPWDLARCSLSVLPAQKGPQGHKGDKANEVADDEHICLMDRGWGGRIALDAPEAERCDSGARKNPEKGETADACPQRTVQRTRRGAGLFGITGLPNLFVCRHARDGTPPAFGQT
jgi:hypothetical protein